MATSGLGPCGGRPEVQGAKDPKGPAWRPRRLSKWVISRVVSILNGATLDITLLITHLLSPLGLQVGTVMGDTFPNHTNS